MPLIRTKTVASSVHLSWNPLRLPVNVEKLSSFGDTEIAYARGGKQLLRNRLAVWVNIFAGRLQFVEASWIHATTSDALEERSPITENQTAKV